MYRLLIIVGPTATGKTKLAISLAKRFQGELISADSRQVYRGMDIGTGKDLPANLKSLPRRQAGQKSPVKWKDKPINYYEIEGIKFWGYDLVNPNEDFNAAFFREIAWTVIQGIWKRGKLPIIVGGTGLYIKAITEPLTTLRIPPDKMWRKKAESLTLKQLQTRIKHIDYQRFNKMNNSDRNNKRRLIRAIELKLKNRQTNDTCEVTKKGALLETTSILKIGLTAPKLILFKRIDERVERRIQQGTENEVRKLLGQGYTFDLPSMSGMGYRQWQPFIKGEATLQEVATRWKLAEHDYARRQLTWFKKDKNIKWFDITRKGWKETVECLVREWYIKLT